jgi:mycothiol synthase
VVAGALVDDGDRVADLYAHGGRCDRVVIDAHRGSTGEVEARPIVRARNGRALVFATCKQTDRDGCEGDHHETADPTHDKATVVDLWGRERASQLAALVDRTLPGEGLTEDEIAFCCWNGEGAVLGLSAGEGAVAVNIADEGPRRIGYVKLVVVDPGAQRRGQGSALVEAAQNWAFDRGAQEVRVGAAAPFYLWPGCDVEHLGGLCLFESLGYWAVGAEVNMRCSTAHRADPPRGARVLRVEDDDVVDSVLALVRREWPHWEPETRRGIELGTCFAALADDDPAVALGYASHSVNRRAWVGPMATDSNRQHGGVGSALLASLCEDMQALGIDEAEIAWVGPVRFYAKAAGARVSRVFRSLTLPRPAAAP